MSTDPSEPVPIDPKVARFETVKKNSAIACFVICPTLALLPPRKLDLYTFSLAGVWLASANHLTFAYTGRSAWQRLAIAESRSASPAQQSRYEQVQRQLREQGIKGAEKVSPKGGLESIWMGDEKEGWKERRVREEREALEKGEGYGQLIAKHFRDALGFDDKKDGSGEDGKKT